MSSLLARGIAHWIVHREELLPVIEIGAGDGSLARDIHAALPFFQKLKIDFNIVEISPVLREIQQGKAPRKTTWHDTLSEALSAVGGKALIYSNELVDAFPPRAFRILETGTIEELFIDSDFNEHWKEARDLPDSSLLKQKWPSIQRIEIHQSYQTYLSEAVENWAAGEILTIDYGDLVDQIYHRRPHGSLRAFLHHNQLTGEDIYNNPGKQDLTCDVNFTDLIRWGEQLSLKTLSYQTQSDFLTPHAKGSSVDHYLLHPDGPGSAFKVLVQQKIR